ncbi:MAG: hypothetical protein R2784_08705 [Saprospiraceae bacterium]
MSNLAKPVITYANKGRFDVFLKVTNALGADSITLREYITVLDLPVADFQSNVNRLDVDFTFTGECDLLDLGLWRW